MSDHNERACTRCGSLLHHEDAGSCDRRFYVSELGMVRTDLAASRRESAALGAMVARLRDALEIAVGSGDGWEDENGNPIEGTLHAALALTPATVGEYVTGIENRLRLEWWCNHGCPSAARYGDDGEQQCGACGTDFKRTPIETLLKHVDEMRTTRALLSDRAPGKENK